MSSEPVLTNPLAGRPCTNEVQPAGISLRFHMGGMSESAAAIERLAAQAAGASVAGFAVALRPIVTTGEGGALARRRSLAVLRRLSAAVQKRVGSDGRPLALTIDAGSFDVASARSVCEGELDGARLYVVCNERSLASQRFFYELWQQRYECRVAAVAWPTVSSGCTLLDNETAGDVLPGTGLQVPAQSAWLYARLDVGRFARADGSLCRTRLEGTLCNMLEQSERRREHLQWPTAALQHDAWMNRRVALEVSGIGSWLQASGAGPGHLASLYRVALLLRRVREMLTQASRRLAADGELLPAIAALDPCRHLFATERREDWASHWQHAVRASALNNRNLLVLSPWSLFPEADADTAYLDLLPALRYADACTFHRTQSLRHWNVDDFARFHRRVWAVMKCARVAPLIAERA